MRSNCLITFYVHTHTFGPFPIGWRSVYPAFCFFIQNNYHGCYYCWLERSQSSQRFYLVLCKYQRSISACNDQFALLVVLIIYVAGEYYLCTYMCINVHAQIMLLFIICVGCCAHFRYSLTNNYF